MKLAIYQTSDLHGYVYPTNYVKDMPLGILKIGSYKYHIPIFII